MYLFINNLNLDFLTIMRIIIDRCKHGRLRDINKQGKTKYGPDNINTGLLAARIKMIYATTACFVWWFISCQEHETIEKTFRNQTLKQTSWNDLNTLINI